MVLGLYLKSWYLTGQEILQLLLSQKPHSPAESSPRPITLWYDPSVFLLYDTKDGMYVTPSPNNLWPKPPNTWIPPAVNAVSSSRWSHLLMPCCWNAWYNVRCQCRQRQTSWCQNRSSTSQRITWRHIKHKPKRGLQSNVLFLHVFKSKASSCYLCR